MVENRQSFFALASTNWQDELSDLEVVSARITAGDGKAVASQYTSPPVRVGFYHLDFQRPESAGQSFHASADLFNAAE